MFQHNLSVFHEGDWRICPLLAENKTLTTPIQKKIQFFVKPEVKGRI